MCSGELRRRVKIEEAVLGSPLRIVPTVYLPTYSGFLESFVNELVIEECWASH